MPAPGTRATAVRLALAALLVTGCARPDWTNPETSKGSRALPAPSARKALPVDPGPAPPVPAWALAAMGKPLHAVFPRDGVCMGNTDGILRLHAGEPRGARIVGWGWEPAVKAPVPRVVVVDASGVIVGAGETGQNRPDVPRAVPAITSLTTGWEAVSYSTTGKVSLFGVIERGRAVCPLAGAEF